MSKPRVLVFTLAYFPFVGGAEVAIKEIIDRSPDYEFEIISADLSKGFWEKYLFPWRGFKRAGQKHQERKFDLIWAVMANQAGMAAAKFKKRYPEVPFLLTLQEGDDLNSWQYRLRLLAPRLFGVFEKADQIQAISHYLARWAKKMGATCPVVVIPNGVDLEKFPVQNQQPQTNKKVIVTTSRLVEKNGVGDLIEALGYLPEDISLKIAGRGPLELKLKQKVKSLKLEQRVTFLGEVDRAGLPGLLAEAGVFVRASLSEGLGISFLESMAMGIPTVGTPVGGIPDFLIEGETGWLCEVNNPKSIAEKVSYILDPKNQLEVARVTAGGEALVRRQYSWDRVAVEMKGVFNTLI